MPPSTPIATYRLQLTQAFGFLQAADCLPYLAGLGISHLYLSPITTARRGSSHGYDVTDPTRLNPELGGEAGFEKLVAACRALDIGIIVDFVPNHMAATAENPWWQDVLRHGRESAFDGFFDIDWQQYDGLLGPAVTLPILGSTLEAAIEKGHLSVAGDNLVYFEHRLPLSPASLRWLVHRKAEGAAADAGLLQGLLRRQNYRLVHWRCAATEINYRRFFDINELVGLRVEDPKVFDAAHVLLFRLVEQGKIHGIRLDHIDGLRDPHAYCRRLEGELKARGLKTPYVLVEKILEADEPLPDFPGVRGTTGYEWANLITRHLIDPAGLSELRAYWAQRGEGARCADAKDYVLDTLFPGELDKLAARLARLSAERMECDSLRQALKAYIIALPVYRTYITPGHIRPEDAEIVRQAVDHAKAAAPDCHPALDLLQRSLLSADGADQSVEFIARLQQLSGPVMAKALEDTHFYRDIPLLALNEVGGNPDNEAASAEEVHRRLGQRQATQPAGLTATATHDTKRGEDARLRIAGLAEISADWIDLMQAWLRRHADTLPSAGHEYLIYQTLVGAWDGNPGSDDFRKRLKQYAVKAFRESKTATSWLDPDPDYEQAAFAFIEARLSDEKFRAAFDAVARRVSLLGALSGLSQLALKALMPGVPDFYQGTEFWDLSMVDPDNRRPVDWAARRLVMRSVRSPDWAALQDQWQNGHIKMALQYQLLQLRRRLPLVFERGDYIPLQVADNPDVLGFARSHDGETVICVIAHQFASITDGGRSWPDYSNFPGSILLPEGMRFTDVLAKGRADCGGTIRLCDLLGTLPVSVLYSGRKD